MSSAMKNKIPMIEVSLPRPSILIVDDDQAFLESAQEFFSSQGYRADTARTPDEAAQMLKEGEGKYQLIAMDINFGELSKTRGDEFVLQNKSLFDRAKIVIFTGAGLSASKRLNELEKEGVYLLEKSPSLTKTLELLTQEESQKQADNITTLIKDLIGQSVGVKVAAAPNSKQDLSDLIKERLKETLVKWLRSRSHPSEPILFYNNSVYSANQLAEEVSNETEVGLALMQMLLSEFENSLGTN